MGRRTLTAATLAAALCLSGSAVAEGAADQKTITAAGTGQVAVKPANRNSESSIRAAVDAAHRAAIPQAIADARAEAQAIAQASGLTVGAIQSVSEESGGPEFGPPPFVLSGPFNGRGFGPGGFGPGAFCGLVPRPIFAHAKRGHRPKLLRVVRHRQCFVPPFAAVRLSVTFTAS
jgi:hypothetical protein